MRHPLPVLTGVFSPDGGYVLTGGLEPAVRLWRASDGSPVGDAIPHPEVIRSVAFSPEGTEFAVGCADGSAHVWEGTPAKLKFVARHSQSVNCVAFSPDGRELITGSADGTTRLWDAETGQPVGSTLDSPSEVKCLAFARGGRAILTGGTDGVARLWEVAPGRSRVPSPIGGAPTRLALWARVMTNLRFRSENALQALDARSWEQARRALEEQGGPPVP
jgi:WD40 repeat protein